MSGSIATELANWPQMDTGAPLPLVLASDNRVVLSYLLADPAYESHFVIVNFVRAQTHSMGSPNDETLHAHPLWKSGLTYYSVFEVSGSPLIEALERIGSVHSSHNPQRYRSLKHFIFTFHDSTFECVAESMTWKMVGQDEYASRFAAMIEQLAPDRRIFVETP